MALDLTSFILGQKSAPRGGGGDVATQPLAVTENGTYRAPAGKAYTPVTVAVPGISVEALNVNANGTYTPTTGKAYGPVTVNVPATEPVLQSKTATVNGTVEPDSGYDGLSSVTVNVPQIDTSDATAAADEILAGKTAYVNGVKITGTATFAPTGTVIYYAGKTAPSGYLACDGTVYNIADYPALAQFMADNYEANNYWGGDGETTFAVPDWQGEFFRAAGTQSRKNQGSGAKVGVHQSGTTHQRFITGPLPTSPSGGSTNFALYTDSDHNWFECQKRISEAVIEGLKRMME